MTEYKKEAPKDKGTKDWRNEKRNPRRIPEEIKEYLTYDEYSGKFICKKYYHKKITVNREVGYLNSQGYIELSFKGKRYLGHRVAWFLYYNKQPEKVLDHINSDRKDNRIVNLRDVSQRQNTLYGLRKNGLIGVRYKKDINKWESRIVTNKKSIYLGVFHTEIEAHEAYTNKLKQIESLDIIADYEQEIADLKLRIKDLESQLKSWDLVPEICPVCDAWDLVPECHSESQTGKADANLHKEEIDVYHLPCPSKTSVGDTFEIKGGNWRVEK